MVGPMYLPSVTELFLAHPPIYLITGGARRCSWQRKQLLYGGCAMSI
jgi:hypothetical protein